MATTNEVEITITKGPDTEGVAPRQKKPLSSSSNVISHSHNKSMCKMKDYLNGDQRFSVRMSPHFLHTQRVILAESRKEKHAPKGAENSQAHETKGAFGSRNVGGQMPTNQKLHDSIESFDYSYKDTVEGALMTRVLSRPDPLFKCCSRGCSRRAVMWFLYAMIGVTVSLLVTGVLAVEGEILKLRVYAAKDLLKSGELGLAWLSWTGSSLILCLIACLCVLIEPAAASSGIPGLIAFLNGVQPKGGHSPITGKTTSFTSWQTMVAKTVGMVASVPSGLCVGPEGPIIHVSALMAHYTCVVFQNLEQRLFPGHRFAAQASEARDFLATGAACGICTAFRAPIAGVMFVVEEAASFFTTQHLEYTFLASLMAYWVTWSLTAYNTGESTVKFKQTSGSFCTYHDMLDYCFFVLVGVFGGCSGSLFNQIVEHLNHLRVHHVNHFAWRRVAEVVFVCLLTGTTAVLLPAAFACKPQLRAIMMEDSAGCLNAGDTFQISGGTVSHTFLSQLLEQANSSNCSAGSGSGGSSRRMLLASDSSSSSSSSSSSFAASIPKMTDVVDSLSRYRTNKEYTTGHPEEDVVWVDNDSKYIHLHYSHLYTCSNDNHEYNEMAMLWMNGGVKAVKVILQRGFPHMLSWQVLLVFCLVYFCLAAITAGISVPAGLVVPMLLIGGSYGRLLGLWALDVKKHMCSKDYVTAVDESLMFDTYYWSTQVRWLVRSCRMPDPGTFAIVGAASFLGGSGRITVMLATVLLELTEDATMIAPVGITCVLSMVIGNLFNHGLYHGLIPVFSIPFLNVDPPEESKLMTASDVCACKPVILPKLCHVNEIQSLLNRCYAADADRDDPNGCTHHAFPVVKSKKNTSLVGMVTRAQLEVALVSAVELGEHTLNFVHLLKYCDRSPISVYKNTRLSRAYNVFQKLGMRHLSVINEEGKIFGMITRKNLMTYLITNEDMLFLIMVKRVQRGTRRFLRVRKNWINKMFDVYTGRVDPKDVLNHVEVEQHDDDRMNPEQLKECLHRVRVDHGHPKECGRVMEMDLHYILTRIFEFEERLPTKVQPVVGGGEMVKLSPYAEGTHVTRAQFHKLLSTAQRWSHPRQQKRVMSRGSAVRLVQAAQDKVETRMADAHAGMTENMLEAKKRDN
jgi:chloride channel 7